MKFFETKKDDRYTVIIGCGRLGASLANHISDAGGNILVIDRDKDAFKRLSQSFGGLTVVGDSTDYDTLGEAQITPETTIIVLTGNDNTNIMLSLITKEVFHAKRVIARLYDPERITLCEDHGIETICPSVMEGKMLRTMMEEGDKKQ